MNRKINNILIFTNTLEKGGAEIQAVELAKTLSDQYHVCLAVFYGDKINDELRNRLDGYAVKLVCFSGKKISCAIELFRLVKSDKIDCIYSFLATTNFYSGIIGRFFKGLYTIGGIRSSVYSGYKLYIQRCLHNYFMTVTVSNNYSAIDVLVSKGFKADKFRVIHNVYPLPQMQYTKQESDIPTIISVARFTQVKDYETALKSILLLTQKKPALRFKYLIIGYGELELDIRKMIDDLSLNDIVDIKINPNNIFENLINSDIYLSSSLFEGTSNSILEAMYAKLPIVATDVGDNSYLVTDKNGFLTHVKDLDSIADRLSLLLLDTALRDKMGDISREIVLTRFSRKAFMQNNLHLLNSLENGKN